MSVESEVGSNTEVRKPLRKSNYFIKHAIKDRYLLLLFAPTLIYILLFKYLPIFGIVIAFKDYNLFLGLWESEWIGLKYFKQFLGNPDGVRIIWNTLILGLYKMIFGFFPPIVLALLLNELRLQMFKRFVQTVSYLPHFISTTIIVSMITMFLSPDGIANSILENIGLQPVNFLVESQWFRTIYISSDIWQDVGWGSIIYLAALAGVSPQLYEAAEIDGASRWRQTWHVTIPGILPAMVILFILDIGKLLEIGFEKVFLLSNPATYSTGDIISTYVYRMGIVSGNFSYGTAADVFMGVVGFTLVFTVNAISRKVNDTSLW